MPFKKRWQAVLSMGLVAVLLITVIATLIISSSGSERYFSGEAEIYYQNLIKKGFPEDYAVSLTELHLLHPTWEFTPLLITEEEPTYTWSHVINKETEKGETNIVYSSDTYAPYHHLLNKELYDSNHYQASRATVEYFMDPRNFLNETDVFQFYSLEGGTGVSLSSIEAVLAGTFMENTKLENGKTYAEYFLELGERTNVNPIFLAAKVRNEQGVNGTSPIISGKCGTKLWDFYQNGTQKTESGNEVLAPSSGHSMPELLALDGYYNFYNVGASGTGLFSIYLGAMERAKTGTPDLVGTDGWSGNAAWDTKWKSLYGGAYFLGTKYVGRYQPTVYLQKFNVDSRSDGNFWRQYMASVFGAMSEGRTLYQSFAALDALDMPANFLIPVYGNMPKSVCRDPALGTVKNFAVATDRFSYQVNLTAPDRHTAKNGAVYLDAEVYPNREIQLNGAITHSYEVSALQYAWDDGEWQTASSGSTLNISIPADFSENTSHILTVRGKATYDTSSKGAEQTIHTTFLAAVIYVKVVPIPTAALSIDIGGTVNRLIYNVGTEVALPACETDDFAGWYGSNGTFLPSGAHLTLTEDVTYSAIFLDFDTLSGAALHTNTQPKLRFSAVIEPKDYEKLTANDCGFLSLSATVQANGIETPSVVHTTPTVHRDGTEWLRLDVSTDAIPKNSLDIPYTAQFRATLHYTDGTERILTPVTPSAQRSAKEVAQAALNDRGAGYSAQTITFLQALTQTS